MLAAGLKLRERFYRVTTNPRLYINFNTAHKLNKIYQYKAGGSFSTLFMYQLINQLINLSKKNFISFITIRFAKFVNMQEKENMI